MLTKDGQNKVFKQSPTPPYFTDSALDAQLNKAAQFQAEYNASVNVMSHTGPRWFSDSTGKGGNMIGLEDRAAFFGITHVVEAAGMGQARNYPHSWMASDTHFRPWFNVDGVYPTLGFGAARAANGTWHFVAVATRYADGEIPGGSGVANVQTRVVEPSIVRPQVNNAAVKPLPQETFEIRDFSNAPRANAQPAIVFSIARNQKQFSPNGGFYLIFQDDGNLVVYTADGGFVWGLNNIVPDLLQQIASIVLQADGNLVAYAAGGEYVWSALHQPLPNGANLHLTDGGVLALVEPGGTVVWSTAQ